MQRCKTRLACLLLLAQTALAQDIATPEEASVEDEILITGERRDPERIKIMLDFVSEMGDPVNRDFGFARLETAACFKVRNTSDAIAEFLYSRLAAVAAETGLEAPKPDCKPNVEILITDDGAATASNMVETRPAFFKPFGNADGTTQDRHALSEFRKSAAPVRWWQITVPVDRSGTPVVPSGNPDEPPYVAGANSNLSSGMRDRLLGTLVIVDTNQLGEATWDQLADYLAMVALVQVDPHASLAGFDTILNLFSGNTVPPAITAWDKAYLQALYSLNLYMLPKVQKAQLANKLMRTLDK